MKKEIRKVSDDGKTVQITIADERFYVKTETDEKGNILSIREYPSVTWKCGCYPKGVGYYMWLAKNGWDESQEIMREAGHRGSKVHNAVESLLLGNTVRMEDAFQDGDGNVSDLTLEEYEALLSFADWHKEFKPETIAIETTVFNDEYNYAGTVDYICKIDGKVWIIDFKTSADVWPSYELQVSAYKHALDMKVDQLGILQLGYKRNKRKWKMNEIEDQFELFKAADLIWQKEHGKTEIFVKDYPTSISL
jgi:hypothetical protein